MGIRSHDQQVGDELIRAATGRSREEWYALLDDAGAQGWEHPRIARWLGGEHDVDGWWAQSVTVGYEQARGMRLPGQNSRGHFEAGATKTITATAQDVWPHLADDDLRSEWLDDDWPLVGTTEPRSVRFEAGDGSRVTVLLEPLAARADGRDRVRVAVQHARLPGEDAVMETKQFWRDCLARLASAVTAPPAS